MNNHFNSILAVQDSYRDSTKAIELASQLVPANGKIKIIDVQPPLTALWHDFFDKEFEVSPSDHRKKTLSEIARAFDFPTPNVTAKVRSGTPVVQIVRETLAHRFDVVLKEVHATATDFIFGSLDLRLIRHCPTPVWIIHPKAKLQCQRIMVAINPEAGEREMVLNKRLLEYAAKVAIGFQCQLFVVAAYQSGGVALPFLDRDSLRRFEEQSQTVQRKSRESLDRLLANCQKPIKSDNVILESGNPDEIILAAVSDVNPDLLVMGSVARHGVSGLLVGNAAERVLRQVNCSVLAVKPTNFVCPIAPDDPGTGTDFSPQFAY